jgi:hypothetical protein
MKKGTILMLALGLAVCSSCSAQKNGHPGLGTNPPSTAELMKMDTNNDGRLSKKEVKGPLQNDFEKVDTNQDGFLSEEELTDAPKPKRGQGPPKN